MFSTTGEINLPVFERWVEDMRQEHAVKFQELGFNNQWTSDTHASLMVRTVGAVGFRIKMWKRRKRE